ncbi:MAG: hypothetical protein MR430_00220 [Lachnospiraceae bacterium]|nr:hypothetical protein [Lachnospiraceae bacterium]
MKRIVKLLAVTAGMILALMGCGRQEPAGEERVMVADPADLLNKVWDKFGEEERFPAMGGDPGNPVDNGAGIFNIEDKESLTYMLYLPAEQAGMIDEAASLIHAMNANTFTGAAFHLTKEADAEALAEALRESILNTRWMCGFPDEMAIYVVNDEYVVSAFGKEEIMKQFKASLSQVFGKGAVPAAEEKIE